MKNKIYNKRIFQIFIAIALVLSILYLLNAFGIMGGIILLDIVPIDCPAGSLCHETYSPFVCPSGVYKCDVRGYMDCNVQQTSTPRVIARTDDVDYSSGWIAYDNGFNGLDSWVYDNYVSITTISGSPVQLPYGFSGFFHENAQGCLNQKCLYVTESSGKYWRYKMTSGADINPSPEYNCSNQEICFGAINKYYCTSILTYKDRTGAIKDSEQIVWESPTSGGTSQSIKEYLLDSGESIELSGSGSRNYIKYSNLQQVETCNSKDAKCKADGSGVYGCNNNIVDYANFTPCNTGETCQDYYCTLPFSLKEVSLAKTGYSFYEDVSLRTKIISTSISSGDLIIKTYRFGENIPIEEKTLSSYDFRTTSNQPVYTSLINPNSQGLYFITLDLKYNNQIVPLIKEGDLQFRISPEVSCNINVKGQDRSELLTGQPIVIELNTYQSGFGSDMDLIDFSGTTLNSNPFTIDKSKCTAGTSGNAYTYTCQASSNIKGDLVVKATITKSGVSNTCSFSKRIDEPTISVEWKDTSFICALPGEHKFYFISKDPFGNYIDTENTLMVYEAGSATPVNRSNLITRTDTGKYEFDYLLSSPLGGAGSAISYKFDVTGYSPDYRKSSSPISGTLEVRTDCSPTECIANSDCQSKYGSNYLCYNGTCKEGTRPNILLYLIIVIAIVVVVLVIFLIIYYSKNKKVDPLGVI